MDNFADRLTAAIDKKGTPACVGLDPDFDSLPPSFKERAKTYPDEAAQAIAVLTFSVAIIEIVSQYVAVVKPQSAYFEAMGSSGIAAYDATIDSAHERGLLVIGDVKRGDIGSTAQAYAAGHLSLDIGASSADAITLNPYLGGDSVMPFIKEAKRNGQGVFILVKTSNPSSAEFQDLIVETRDGVKHELFMEVAAKVNEWGKDLVGERGYSSVGAVVGATYPEQAARLRKAMPNAYFLVPGYGAQGGTADDVIPSFNDDGLGAIVNSSRGIIYAWKRSPYKEQFGEERWEEAVEAAVKDMVADINSALKRKQNSS